MRRIILQNFLSPGDLVLLTAAVRDLHRCYPGQFLTDVRTSCPDLWENNPYLTPLEATEPGSETIECECPLINEANIAPYHSLHGYIEDLNRRLGLQIRPTEFKGDIHLSRAEKSWKSPTEMLVGREAPFWLVSSGGKYDLTIKWWDADRYQAVVNHFLGRIQFIQVGRAGDFHPRLEGAIDLRGRTTLRQLIRLVYHAQGVLCGVTALMHLAAAIEVKGNESRIRPCVVVAGGREPPHWEAYPGHQFVHTIGALPCCAQGGCWKSRTFPLGDGESGDHRRNLCVDPAGELPRCMDLITPAEVIRRIETYFECGMVRYLDDAQAHAARRAVEQRRDGAFDQLPLSMHSVRLFSERFIRAMEPCPQGYAGRGIVICAGGASYFTNAWVCLNRLRKLGCTLPVQLWYLGPDEMDDRMKSLVAPLGVQCVDALEVRQTHPVRLLRGWAIKPYALVYCPFREVLLLDADNVPVVNPEFLFDTAPYVRKGAVFWPDFDRPEPPREVWRFCGVRYRKEPPFETGQVLVDKLRCWKALRLCLWYNEHADFFYRYVYGDKETFHLAFRKVGCPFAMPSKPIQRLPGTMCQHDFAGRRIFQHRNTAKWDLREVPQRIKGFWFERECRDSLAELARLWDGRIAVSSGTGLEVSPHFSPGWTGPSPGRGVGRRPAEV